MAPGTSRWRAFAKGLLAGPIGITGFVIFATAMGFGALARDLGLTLGHTLFMGLAIYALPGQVVLADELSRGTGLIAAGIAVTLTAVRMLPMTVTLVPLMNDGRRVGPLHVLAVHFVSVTSWIEGQRQLPAIPVRLRLSFFLGLGISFATLLVLGSLGGYVVAGALPPLVSAALLLMTPMYFMMSLLEGARRATDLSAIAFGALLGPVMFYLLPGFDLMLTGLIGGTAAWLIGMRTPR
jgi:predicted branched-subunit amino acid permease